MYNGNSSSIQPLRKAIVFKDGWIYQWKPQTNKDPEPVLCFSYFTTDEVFYLAFLIIFISTCLLCIMITFIMGSWYTYILIPFTSLSPACPLPPALPSSLGPLLIC